MPLKPCSVCILPPNKLAALNEALRKGSPSQRALAGQFDLKKSAISRHAVNHLPRIANKHADVSDIDREIQRLLRAQRQQRDRAAQLAISKELRAWYVLRAKFEATRAVAAVATSPATNVTNHRNSLEEKGARLVSSHTHGKEGFDTELALTVAACTNNFDPAAIAQLKQLADAARNGQQTHADGAGDAQ